MAYITLDNWQKTSEDHRKVYKNFLQRPDKNKVLRALPQLEEEAYEAIDCLKCGNCCRNHSPRFKTPDIKRISKRLKMKEGDFIETYLRLDNDGDYVNKTTQCQFLGSDNYCGIYDDRPGDCARYPYTAEDVLIKRPVLTLKNTQVCPIVVHVLEALIKAK